MRSFAVAAVALFAFGCGDVLKVPDAGPVDAYVPDSPTEPTCTAPETLCNGSCANLTNSELYCGNCNTQCVPTQGCLNGACVPANTSCARVKELDPAAADGAYRNPNNVNVFYCDFTAHKQYEFGLGQHNLGYFQYTSMTVASFDAATKTAFLGVYNLMGGLATISSFMSNTCCITQTSGNELSFGTSPNYLSLALNGTNACNIMYNGTYQLMKGQGVTGLLAPPLPNDFFTTSPVGESTACGDSVNIGLFSKITSF